MYRVDFYLDEPIGSSKAIEDLRRFTADNKQHYGIPNEIPVVWLKTLGHNLSGDRIQYTINKALEAVTGPNDIIMFWAAEHHIMLDELSVDKLNWFASSISNPIIFVTGVLGEWHKQWEGRLNFTVAPLMYFDFEAANMWDQTIEIPKTRTRKFMSMGTKDYPNRKYLLSKIINNGFLDQGYVSYKQVNNGNLALVHYSQQDMDAIVNEGNSINHLLPLPVLDNSIEYTRMPRKFMLDSYLNVVTDTFYEHWGKTTFISEKVFNAMIHQQMFIMHSPPGTLAYLRSQGYKTFIPHINEDYDDIEDNAERLRRMSNTLLGFLNQPLELIHEVHKSCKPILEHNQQHVYSRRLCTQLLELLNEKVKAK